jgi:hypothetical protein
MKKAKPVKMKASELFAASDKTMESLGNDKRKVEQQAARGLQSALSDNPTPFDCRRCGTRFQPKPHQWIFYDLCDTCFEAFDTQKMHDRVELLINKHKIAYFEDADAWMTALPYSPIP